MKLVVGTVLLIAMSFWITTQLEIKHQSESFEHVLNPVDAQPTVKTDRAENVASASLPPLQAESTGHVELDQIRQAYGNIRFQDGRSTELFQNLSMLAKGLQSETPVVRHTTEDLVRHLLSRWVFSTPASEWHQIHEIDDFFKTYAKTENPSLHSYLKFFRNGPEARYLSQL